MTALGIFEARERLPALLDAIERGDKVIIMSHGEAVAEVEPVHEEEEDDRRRRIEAAMAFFKAWREKNRGRFAGIDIRELIDEGRRI
jgi:antitoxin (DNA-binding transcriptional repressor) of toxin-antitoxin stability system